MQHKFKIIIFILIQLLLLSSCVSVQLPRSSGQKSQTVSATPPPAPYQPLSTTSADKAWLHKSNGATISYSSDCHASVDLSIDSLMAEVLKSVDSVTEHKIESINYNSRLARHARIQGTVDGVAIYLEILVFKKNNCNYLLSLTSSPEFRTEQSQIFQKFLEGFRAL